MVIGKQYFLVFLFLAGVLFGCKPPKKHHAPAFYYWKNTYVLSDLEKITLSHLKVEKLYVRLFDVVWNEAAKAPFPEGLLKAEDALSRFQIVPVIYINNEVFEKIDLEQSEQLAFLVNKQINEMATNRNFGFQAIQINCLWKPTTQANYFAFLDRLKRINKRLQLSVTLSIDHIHQSDEYGIPPTDAGTLLFYKTNELDENFNRNAIFNPEELKKKSSSIHTYPLQLSVALPLFSWAVLSRDGQAQKLLPRRRLGDFSDPNYFTIDSCFVYVKTTGVYKGIQFQQGDSIKVESVQPEECIEAATILKDHAPDKGYEEIIFFDLDEHNIDHFDHDKITDIYQLLP